MSGVCIKPCALGEGLFATRSIAKGEEIFAGRFEYFALNEEQLNKACQNCTRPASKACPRCGLVQYCNLDCQNADMVLHELECTFAKKVHPNRPTQSHRILLRALKHKTLPNIQFNLDNVDSELLGYYLQGIRIIKHVFSEAELPFSPQQLLKFQCMLKYGCTVIGDEDRSIGIAYSALLSKVNHSCAPNSIYTGSNNQFSLIAIADISAGEEIMISYIDADSSEAMNKDLKKYFGFTCANTKCCKTLH